MVETAKGLSENIKKLVHINSIIPNHYNPSVRLLQIPKTSSGSCGFHLSRSKWDPYPWVSAVDDSTPAEMSGLKVGDCVLEVNSEDILGLRITEVADLVKTKPENVSLLLWSTGMDPTCDAESLCCGPMPLNLERLSASMQIILAALECPICLDTISPPANQCQNGHLLCAKCRMKSDRCPVCRERYSPGRSLLAEQVYNSVTEAFNLQEGSDGKLREKLFGARCQRILRPNIDRSKNSMASHTNKFLARIMGKATSLDNLVCKKDTGNQLNVAADGSGNNKQLSLSTNDISRPSEDGNIAIPRCPSLNRTNPDNGPISNRHLYLKRPLSCNTSTECIHSIGNSELSLVVPILMPKDRNETGPFLCPLGGDGPWGLCESKFMASSLHHHVKVYHNTPIIYFGLSKAEISIPPRTPVEDAFLVVAFDSKQFWIKLRIDDDESIFTSALLEGSDDECSQYMLEAKIRNKVEDKLLQRELTTRSIIHSLTGISWMEVLEKQMGIFYDYKTIRMTFGNDDELILRVDVKCRDE